MDKIIQNEQVHFRVTEAESEQLDKICDELKINRSEYFRQNIKADYKNIVKNINPKNFMTAEDLFTRLEKIKFKEINRLDNRLERLAEVFEYLIKIQEKQENIFKKILLSVQYTAKQALRILNILARILFVGLRITEEHQDEIATKGDNAASNEMGIFLNASENNQEALYKNLTYIKPLPAQAAPVSTKNRPLVELVSEIRSMYFVLLWQGKLNMFSEPRTIPEAVRQHEEYQRMLNFK